MNTVIAARPLLRAKVPSETVAWLARHLDLAPTHADPRWGLALDGERLAVVEHGELAPALELVVTRVDAALKRCEQGGASCLQHADGRATVRLPGGEIVALAGPDTIAAPAGDGPVHFTVGRLLDVPAEAAFEALTSAKSLEKTFVRRASGDLAQGGTVEWWWTDHASSTLEVLAVDAPRSLSFTWHAHHVPYRTSVRFDFTETPRGLRAAIKEGGWQDDALGRSSAFAHAESWTELLVHADLHLRHGLELVELARPSRAAEAR